MRVIIGLDIGHSAVKVVTLSDEGRNEIIFPSVVTKAVRISDNSTAAAAKRETVEVDGVSYFFGATAIEQGGAKSQSGLSSDWIMHVEHKVLFAAAIKKVSDSGILGVDEAMVVLGLPAANYSIQKEPLVGSLSGMLESGMKLMVQPQPCGPYHMAMLTASGEENPDHTMSDESWGVVEVGHFTTDFMLMKHGRWIERAAGSCEGVHAAAHQLQNEVSEKKGFRIGLLEAEVALRTGFVKNFGRQISVRDEVALANRAVVDQVIDRATSLLGEDARMLTGVIVAGGGAPLVFDRIKDRWPHAIMPENPRMSVAEGFARFGRAVTNIMVESEAE